MVTRFSQFIPAKVKKISASMLGKVKKIEAQEKSAFLIKKRVLSYIKKCTWSSCGAFSGSCDVQRKPAGLSHGSSNNEIWHIGFGPWWSPWIYSLKRTQTLKHICNCNTIVNYHFKKWNEKVSHDCVIRPNRSKILAGEIFQRWIKKYILWSKCFLVFEVVLKLLRWGYTCIYFVVNTRLFWVDTEFLGIHACSMRK